MRFADLVADLGDTPSVGDPEVRAGVGEAGEILDVVHDSRSAQGGTLFCAVPGFTVDGHDFAAAAVENGATALLVERWVETDRPQVKVPSVRRAMPWASAIVHGHPSRELAIFGITGTNGKTTTTQLFASILEAAGRRTEIVGTLAGVHTTPEGTELQRRFRRAADAGVEVIAAEISSHALDQHRVDGTEFAVAAFSNLSPDHLDYHHTLEDYFDAKRRLFDGRAEIELINIDDPWGARLAADRPHALPVTTADVSIEETTLTGTRFIWRGNECVVTLPGDMNVANALMAMEAASALGVDDADVATGLARAPVVPGRMEVVPAAVTGGPTVIVDYSHTPASIEFALSTIRDLLDAGRILIVFGCGGDRDRAKRPLMGASAEAGADVVFVTSDNPRSEDPASIIDAAVAGMRRPERAIVEPDRRRAIECAIEAASPADVVLIAGKGHEKTQTIGAQALPFDDVAVAAAVLDSRLGDHA